MKFLVNVLATIVGLIVFCMIFFFGIMLIGALFSSDTETVTVKDNSVINLDISKIEYDYAGKVTYDDLTFLNNKDKHNGLTDAVSYTHLTLPTNREV